MVRDLLDGVPAKSEPANVCIIGAGAAGILLALDLSRQGKRVLLLEGGGADVEEDSQEPYQSEVSGLDHTGIHIGRFRAWGGSTTRWGGQILELDNLDFEKRPWIEGSGWPFPKSGLAQYYARAIGLEGLGSAILDDDAVWRKLGVDPPAYPELKTVLSRWCPEPNFARLHRRKLEEDARVELWLHANAVSPLVEGARIRGIRCKTLTGIEHTFAAEQFVWCMGGIESSRFFLQPELAAMPWRQNGLLGRHFQDHTISCGAVLQVTDCRRFHAAFDNIFLDGVKYQPKIWLDRRIQEQHHTLNVAASIFTHSETDEVELAMKATARKLLRGNLGGISGWEIAQLARNAPLLTRQAWRYARAHRAYIPAGSRIELGVHCEQPPLSASSITLAGTRDRLGMLRTRLDWRISDLEIHSIRTYVQIALKGLASVARAVPDQDLFENPDAFRRKCGDGYHHMGGMRMSASAADGLVDLDLKLHGMDNGYVCSSAVFPASGFSNPTHTLLALSLRLADHLSGK